jgi:Sec-independent protein secretion pathway component TatC
LPLYSEKFVKKLPSYQKDYIFVMSVVSGVLTPTIDVATQINFIIISVSLYNSVISLLKKYSTRILSF